MFEEGADTLVELDSVGGVFAHADGIEPVLALDVVAFLFAVGEGRGCPGEFDVVVGVVVEGEGTEEGAVSVVFEAVEIDVEFECLVEGAEGGGAGVGDEAVGIASPDGEKAELKAVADAVAEETLEVGVG